MKKLMIIISVIVFPFVGKAQDKKLPDIMFRGKIHFERKQNIHNQLDEMGKNGNKSWIDRMKENVDKYKVDKFELIFERDKSLYRPEEDGIHELKMMWGGAPAEKNRVYSDFENKNLVAQKEIYDKVILLNDSLKKFQWKIKEEFRNIAGYNCRRAETIIMDSVWVVAFYTDAIVAPGGPESFNGLPGMILGIVMPRLNVTYFATDIENYLQETNDIRKPTKGSKMTQDELEKYLTENMKRWGDWVQRILWFVTI